MNKRSVTVPSQPLAEVAEDSSQASDVEPENESLERNEKVRDLTNIADIYRLVKEEDEDEIKSAVAQHLEAMALKAGLDRYLVLYLYDANGSISSYHANRIYEAASVTEASKDILLVIQSGGGRIEPAYLISKTCKRLSKDRFIVAVPRRAKSAATLLALGADEIHMGLMSELGPIDPQINGYPALGLTNALNKVSELSARFPKSSGMWSQYLGAKLDLNDLGYFDRVSESAAQYAERLITPKKLPKGRDAANLANHFVNHYKDHGFVIDYDETIGLLGSDIVKTKTAEYAFANDVYNFLDLVGIFAMSSKREVVLIGTPDSLWLRERSS